MSTFRTVDPGPVLTAWEREHPLDPRVLVEVRKLVDEVTADVIRQMMDLPRAERTS